ncbi:helix-turn-helix domain-containing protein [Dactylosporangium sp. NPDC000244]|uniref:TetR/AcrR family transcriptional regulator n=1 Tax=Dactylosporangium sp. NPDC000244 TaxID=3154365 RepID=UPI0033325773
MLYGVPTPQRRDAQRNRSAIVRAASELMLSRAAVLMPEVARRAGVGQATLYRHFRDRPTLVDAVVVDQLARLEADDSRAFRELLASALRLYAVVRPLSAAPDGLDRRLAAALAPALRRAQEQGRVRPDLVPDDLALLFAMLPGACGDGERAIALLLDGVCR